MSKGKLVDAKIISMIRFMQSHKGVCVEEIMQRLGVSRASVYRYLQTIQYDMKLPLISDTRNRKAYYYFDSDDINVSRNIIESLALLPEDFQFSEEDKLLIEYLFADAERNPSIGEAIKGLHEKMSTLLAFAGHVTQKTKNDRGIISSLRLPMSSVRTFEELPKKVGKDQVENLSRLCAAARDKKVCEVTYRTTFPETIKSHNLMPLIVFSYNGGFYVIAETDEHEFTTKYSVERFIKVDVTDRHFERKTTLDVERVLTDPFGIVQGDQFEADILIKKDAVNAVITRQWPADRVSFSKPDDNGNIVMHVITSGEYELIRWLRYMGSDVQLLTPASTIAKLNQSIRSMLNEK